jgi:hypothetical protein
MRFGVNTSAATGEVIPDVSFTAQVSPVRVRQVVCPHITAMLKFNGLRRGTPDVIGAMRYGGTCGSYSISDIVATLWTQEINKLRGCGQNANVHVFHVYYCP